MGLQFHKRIERFTRVTRRSKEGRTEDALASIGEEGRGKLRKGAGICKQEMIRTCPNGGTQYVEDVLHIGEQTQGTETS